MPLIKNKSKEAFKSNLKAELKAGKPKDRALAIAFRVQREAKAFGGKVGGAPSMQSGFVGGPTAGRADKIPAAVKANSYIVPADVVSSIGQGNSIAGANALYRLFRMGPYGSPSPRRSRAFADGGVAQPATEIIISDGEFSVPPEAVAEIGEGDVARGHEILDEMVKHIRNSTIKTLKGLPGPKK